MLPGRGDGRILVAVEPERLAEALVRLYRGYLTLDQLALHLGTSTKTAGRVAAKLERLGLLERHSRRTFRLSLKAERRGGD
jgi:uncharacterized protein with von Willebrand factor type A (vWA) domain